MMKILFMFAPYIFMGLVVVVAQAIAAKVWKKRMEELQKNNPTLILLKELKEYITSKNL